MGGSFVSQILRLATQKHKRTNMLAVAEFLEVSQKWDMENATQRWPLGKVDMIEPPDDLFTLL